MFAFASITWEIFGEKDCWEPSEWNLYICPSWVALLEMYGGVVGKFIS